MIVYQCFNTKSIIYLNYLNDDEKKRMQKMCSHLDSVHIKINKTLRSVCCSLSTSEWDASSENTHTHTHTHTNKTTTHTHKQDGPSVCWAGAVDRRWTRRQSDRAASERRNGGNALDGQDLPLLPGPPTAAGALLELYWRSGAGGLRLPGRPSSPHSETSAATGQISPNFIKHIQYQKSCLHLECLK